MIKGKKQDLTPKSIAFFTEFPYNLLARLLYLIFSHE